MFDWANKSGNGIFRSRSATKAAKNIGVIQMPSGNRNPVVRDKKLDLYDAYYERTQYNSLPEWEQPNNAAGEYIAVRKRKPRFNIAFAKTLSQRVASKLLGDSVFPAFKIAESPDDEAFVKAVIRESMLQARVMEPIRRMLNTGSVLVRFYLAGGAVKVEWYKAKFCYPVFQDNGELESVMIRYVFDDPNEKDSMGNPVKKWFRMDLGMMGEVIYDNPVYKPDQNPDEVEFQVASSVEHGLGFVQAEWFRTSEESNTPDGYGLVSDLMEFIDELNYSLSQSSQAVSYNQDPQLTLNKMDEDEIGNLIRSATKSWNLGREGEAKFLESNLAGVERAIELRDKVRLNIQDISRIVLLDPEKIIGSAQSAKAMEILHGPLKDLIDELRKPIEHSLKAMVMKMCIMVLVSAKKGIPVPIMMPAGYSPMSLDIEIEWPPIFQQTMEDLQKKVAVASQAATASIISRETLTKWLAKDFGVDNIDEELQRIASQPVINPFGGF